MSGQFDKFQMSASFRDSKRLPVAPFSVDRRGKLNFW